VSATTIMLTAFALLILGHWANNEPAVTAKTVVELAFALFFIAFLENIPATQGIAQGFAWLFLAAVLLSGKSILTGLAKTTGTGTGKAA
jgi:hypothetical protein